MLSRGNYSEANKVDFFNKFITIVNSRGARGITVIVVGSRLVYQSSDPEQGCSHFPLREYTWKRYESNYSLSSYG